MKKLEKIIAKLFLGAALTVSPLMTGCEDYGTDNPSYNNNPAEGHAVASGTWYKKEEGTTSSGWKWYWGRFYLEQEGTNVWGFEKWEMYGAISIKGHVDGNKLHLEGGTESYPVYFDGTINGNSLSVHETSGSGDNVQRSSNRKYIKESDEIPEWAW